MEIILLKAFLREISEVVFLGRKGGGGLLKGALWRQDCYYDNSLINLLVGT